MFRSLVAPDPADDPRLEGFGDADARLFIATAKKHPSRAYRRSDISVATLAEEPPERRIDGLAATRVAVDEPPQLLRNGDTRIRPLPTSHLVLWHARISKIQCPRRNVKRLVPGHPATVRLWPRLGPKDVEDNGSCDDRND